MRILITNDDGLWAPGLKILTAIANELAGPSGEVWTVAPAFEQSGVGHAISYVKPMMISEMGLRRFAVDGSPADCVLAGLFEVLKDNPPDLVLSGVNRGNNAGENTLYSGTIGAAIEASLHHFKSIALSQYYGPGNADCDEPFSAARDHGVHVIQQLLEKGVWHDGVYEIFYNVNFPPIPAQLVKGSKIVGQGFRTDTEHTVQPQVAPTGRKFLWIKGGPQQTPTEPGTDVHANMEGFISVTPMRADLTAHDQLAALRSVFD